MRKVLALLLLFCSFFGGYAQNELSGPVPQQVDQLVDLSEVYKHSEKQKSENYARKALRMASEAGYLSGQAAALMKLGELSYNDGDFAKAENHFKNAAKLFKVAQDTKRNIRARKLLAETMMAAGNLKTAGELLDSLLTESMAIESRELEATMLISRGVLLMHYSKYTEAANLQFKALRIAEKLKDQELMVNALKELGNIYSIKGDFVRANEYYLKAYTLNKQQGDKLEMADLLCNIGANHLKDGNLKEARQFTEQSLLLSKSLDYKSTMALNQLNLGYIYTALGDYGKAGENLNQAEKLFDIVNDKKGLANTLNAQAYKLANQKQFQEASDYYAKSNRIAQKISATELVASNYQGLAYAAEKLNDYKSALSYYKMADKLAYQLSSKSNNLQLANLDLNYKFEKQLREERMRQQLNEQLRESEVKNERQLKNFMIVLAVNAIGVIIILLFLFYEKRKTNAVLEAQNKEISEQKQRSDDLLLNILPTDLADEIKELGGQSQEHYNLVTILFVDVMNFSEVEKALDTEDLVDELGKLFGGFDSIIKKYKIEKIRTVGDAYLCATGLKGYDLDANIRLAEAASEIIEHANKLAKAFPQPIYFKVNAALHSGPLVAGIVGVRKCLDDVWGDTVKITSNIQKSGKESKVYVSGTTQVILHNHFHLQYSHTVPGLSDGEYRVFTLGDRREALSNLHLESNRTEDLLGKIGSSGQG